MTEHQNDVGDRQVELGLEESGGRVEAPDRVEAILGRIAAGTPVERPAVEAAGVAGAGFAGVARANSLRRLWIAALLLLGLGTTIAAAWLARDGDEPASVGREQVVEGASPLDPQAGDANVPPTGLGTLGNPAGAHAQGLPKGTDPADIAAMRSAEQMLAAERKLQQLIAAGKIGGVDQVLPFDELNDWAYTEGLAGMPSKVQSLDGKKVLMLGFMLPIDEVQDIGEFLLVESLWSCCYGEPPNIHGMVRCTLPASQRLDYQFDPLKVVGTLRIRPTLEDGYVVDIYQLEVDYVEVVH